MPYFRHLTAAPSEAVDVQPTDVFSALALEMRLRCLLLLLVHKELCVCELTHATGAAQPTMSRHLAHLREAGLVVDRREGLWVHYRLNPDLPPWVLQALQDTATGIGHLDPFATDAAALADMPNRPRAPRCS
jgi:ArsR family transcriptional regulator